MVLLIGFIILVLLYFCAPKWRRKFFSQKKKYPVKKKHEENEISSTNQDKNDIDEGIESYDSIPKTDDQMV